VNWLPIILLLVAGFLVGGVISLWRTDHRIASVLAGVIAAGCIAAAVLWLIPGDDSAGPVVGVASASASR
jgi:hypothetical protein